MTIHPRTAVEACGRPRTSVGVDRDAALRFLRTAYRDDDWVAVFLKSYATGRIAQRIAPLSVVMSSSFQDWLVRENNARVNIYIGLNTIRLRTVSRRRTAIETVRHVFLDADGIGQAVLRAIDGRDDLPTPSYLLQTSPGRLHVFWRVVGFTVNDVEALQKHLARELKTDPAATACTQTTRIPGFVNHKREHPWRVTASYGSVEVLYTPADFPIPAVDVRRERPATPSGLSNRDTTALERARRYLAKVPPAVSGQHGDVHTFRVCCRLVRGFALSDREALHVLAAWNERCQPSWSERDLADKVARARRYGREPIGGLLGGGA